MSALFPALDMVVRPRLMIVSARYALDDYNRALMLPRLLGLPVGRALPEGTDALNELIAIEQAMELSRKRHDAGWRAAQHVAVMTALLHEAQRCLSQRVMHAENCAQSVLGGQY